MKPRNTPGRHCNTHATSARANIFPIVFSGPMKIEMRDTAAEKGQPQGRMPAWGQTLNDQQIDAVIDWLQSLWPEPVYTIWYERQKHARVDK